MYEPRPGPTPPAPLPPNRRRAGHVRAANLRLRIAPEEYCPAWPDDEEEDNPLPGWVEGDSNRTSARTPMLAKTLPTPG